MTESEYRAIVKSLGLTPCRPSHNGATLHQGAGGLFHFVVDADYLTFDERPAAIQALKWSLGIVDH